MFSVSAELTPVPGYPISVPLRMTGVDKSRVGDGTGQTGGVTAKTRTEETLPHANPSSRPIDDLPGPIPRDDVCGIASRPGDTRRSRAQDRVSLPFRVLLLAFQVRKRRPALVSSSLPSSSEHCHSPKRPNGIEARLCGKLSARTHRRRPTLRRCVSACRHA